MWDIKTDEGRSIPLTTESSEEHGTFNGFMTSND